MPKLIRMYIVNVLIGFAIAAAFVAMLLYFNIANLWHLVTHSDIGWLAVLILWISNGVIFAGVQFGIAVMRMKDDDDDGPRWRPCANGLCRPRANPCWCACLWASRAATDKGGSPDLRKRTPRGAFFVWRREKRRNHPDRGVFLIPEDLFAQVGAQVTRPGPRQSQLPRKYLRATGMQPCHERGRTASSYLGVTGALGKGQIRSPVPIDPAHPVLPNVRLLFIISA